jgi:hypothetical protein
MLKGLEALQQKQIYEILDGDTKCLDDVFSEHSLKYLSGSDICKLSISMGSPQEYTSLSRWQYMEVLIADCIKHNKINDLLIFVQ